MMGSLDADKYFLQIVCICCSNFDFNIQHNWSPRSPLCKLTLVVGIPREHNTAPSVGNIWNAKEGATCEQVDIFTATCSMDTFKE